MVRWPFSLSKTRFWSALGASYNAPYIQAPIGTIPSRTLFDYEMMRRDLAAMHLFSSHTKGESHLWRKARLKRDDIVLPCCKQHRTQPEASNLAASKNTILHSKYFFSLVWVLLLALRGFYFKITPFVTRSVCLGSVLPVPGNPPDRDSR